MNHNEINTDRTILAKLRLWQLISPSLPVGAYAYSQGLEYAIDAGWLKNEEDVQHWISGQIEYLQASLDIPVLYRLYQAWQQHDLAEVEYWSRFLLACREASELHAEDIHLGRALATLLTDLGINQAETFKDSGHAAYATLVSLAGVAWSVPVAELAHGYIWSWAENQVAAAIKLVPLGQTAGQRILYALPPCIGTAVEQGSGLEDDEIGFLAPALGIAGALHETQYSRLFRS